MGSTLASLVLGAPFARAGDGAFLPNCRPISGSSVPSPPPRTCGSLVDLSPRETDRWLRVFPVPEGGVARARVLWVDRERRIPEEVPSWWGGGKL